MSNCGAFLPIDINILLVSLTIPIMSYAMNAINTTGMTHSAPSCFLELTKLRNALVITAGVAIYRGNKKMSLADLASLLRITKGSCPINRCVLPLILEHCGGILSLKGGKRLF